MEAEAKKPIVHDDDKSEEVAKDFFVSESDITGEREDAGGAEKEEASDAVSGVKEGGEQDKEKDGSEEQQKVKQGHESRPQVIGPGIPIQSEVLHEEDKKGVDWPEKAAALKNFVKERGIVVSNVIRRLSGRKEDLEQAAEAEISTTKQQDGELGGKRTWSPLGFMKLNTLNSQLPVESHREVLKLSGRVTLFSKSGCADSRAARSLLRQKGLPFVEVNLDLFPQRSLDLEERTGTSSVPQVFFNEHLIGGIDELNAAAKNGELEDKIREVVDKECPATAPALPNFNEDEPENAPLDEFAEVVRKLREKVVVKDRIQKFRHFTKCFVGADAVEFLAEDQYCEREEAVMFGRKIVKKHFFHHVLNENDFEDGSYFYRFLEHDPHVFRCLNFSGLTNDFEPKPAAEVSLRLRKVLLAIYDSYISEDGKHVNYYAIATSEEYQRYLKLAEELQRIDLFTLSREEKLSLFLNIYNAMVVHALISFNRPTGPLERRRFFGDIHYVIGGYAYSLSAIQNGILRANLRPPYEFTKPLGAKDPRLQVALKEPEPLVHFALSYGTTSSPAVRCYSPEGVDAELRMAARDYFDATLKIDTEARTVWMSKMMKWYSVDFGKDEREVLHWIVKHASPTKAEHLLSLLEDKAAIKVNYVPHEWFPNV